MAGYRGKFAPFGSKQEARDRARKYHACLDCRKSSEEKWAVCPNCGGKNRQYFMSRAELQQGMALLIRRDIGEIDRLRFQPRFDLVINTQKIGVYTADADYYENGVYVVEDTKAKEFMEELAKLKIKIFQALYGVTVRIPQRKSKTMSKTKPTNERTML